MQKKCRKLHPNSGILPCTHESRTHVDPSMHANHHAKTIEIKSSYPGVRIQDSVQRFEIFPELNSSSNPNPRIYHGVDSAITTVLLLSYNKQTTQQQQNKTHTHTRDPRRRQTSHDWSQHENKGQLFQLIRTFVKKVSVWEETKISVNHATRLKFKNVHK